MYKRPSVKDTEEDLLRQQAEFLKETKGVINAEEPLKSTESNPNVETNEIKKDSRISIIGEIVQRNDVSAGTGGIEIKRTTCTKTSFPSVFRIEARAQTQPKTKKKSLFALKLEEKSGKVDAKETEEIIKVDEPFESVQPEAIDVHKENIARIKSMTTEEILTEKQSLEGMLSPEMLAFLKARGAKKKGKESIETPLPENTEPKLVDFANVKKNLTKTVDSEWHDIDKIEPEKLEWIGDIPDAKSLDPDKPYSARFDFYGDLQPFHPEIDVRTSLHHHGDEPERPGYTIQEIYQLSRSTVLQQRIIALNTLANIIRKTKMGYYDQCFDGVLLKKLVESDVFFLLRFSMDDRTVTPAAVNCLNEFFSCRPDEVCLDRLLNVTEEDEEPILFVPFEIDNDTEEAELKDRLILEQDIVKGVLRTDILVRFNYILREFAPDKVTKGKIFETLVRICRHSQDSCEKVLTTPGLISAVFENIYSSEPLHQAVKLLRVLVSASPNNARVLTTKSFSFILKFIDMDTPDFKLKLESLALWKALIRLDLMVNEFQNFTPCLTRLLFFYVEKVDANHGHFDFELFAAIVSLINVVLSKQNPVDKHYGTLLEQCLRKWFTQLQKTSCSYSAAKAVGAALRYFILKFSIHGVESNEVDFLKALGTLLASWLKSETFLGIARNLNLFSHIQKYLFVDRDPSNLPSLLAVYGNGSGYVSFLHESSCLLLLISLAHFLMKLVDISNESKPLLVLFATALNSYFEKTLNCSENSCWFSRYEAKLLAALCETHVKLSNEKAMNYCFQCVSFFRSDDKSLLKIIEIILNTLYKDLSDVYIENFKAQFKPVYFHKCTNIPKDWMYSPLAKDFVNILKFISSILQTSPSLLSRVCHTARYYRLSTVFLDEENIFNAEIQASLEICLKDILEHFNELDFNQNVSQNKSFYELLTELVTQYAATSYGNVLFAKFITLPLAQKFNASFRKLLWSEYMHAVRVITLPENVSDFIDLADFVNPVETDESLLVTYLNAITKNVVTVQRNGFIFSVAVENLKQYLSLPEKDERLAKFICNQVRNLDNLTLKRKLLPSDHV